MSSNLSRYKADLEKLQGLGAEMQLDLEFRHLANTSKVTSEQKENAKKFEGSFPKNYQKWYSEAFTVVAQLTPHRIEEFEQLYKGDSKRRSIDARTYSIQDWLNGIRAAENAYGKKVFDDFGATIMRFQTQCNILDAVSQRFESSLFDIRQLVQADILDSEIDTARELTKHGYIRAAGAVVGVVLEKHLAQVAENHDLTIRKHPTISTLNDALKGASVLEIPTWRAIQRLGDLRNLCDHGNTREPTAEEVTELIDGTEKVTKTLY
jgi:hypothetical protein